MRRKVRNILGLSFVAMLILSMILLFPVFPQTTTRIYLDPSDYIFDPATTSVGTLFNVTVKVANIPEDPSMAAWQVRMFYNDTIINVTRWFEPTWNTEYVFYDKGTMPAPFPPDAGYAHVGPGNGSAQVSAALFPPPPTVEPFSGDGTLCIFEFNITLVPPEGETYSCQLDIESVDTFYVDPGAGQHYYNTYENGYYQIGLGPPPYDVTIEAYCYTEGKDVSVSITKDGAPTGYNTPHIFTGLTGSHNFTVPGSDPSGHPFKQWSTGETSTTITVSSAGTFTAYYGEFIPVGTKLYVDPSEVIDPNITPCSTFDINITIDDVENMLICEFNLTYDTEVLSWAGFIVRRVEGKMPRTNMDANDDAGYIWIKLNYSDPVTTSDPIALVTITFHVQGMGATPLDLHDTELLDPDGQPIEHEAEDGYFAAQIRDVAIVNVVPSRDWVYQGWFVDINVTAKNLGNVNENFTVKAYYDGDLIEALPVVDLAPDAEITLTFSWNTSLAAPCYNYTITGEATTVPYELNITNNTYIDGKIKVRFMGDITGDDKVNIEDIFIVISAFGSFPGHPLWNPEADLDPNGRIDIVDIFLTVRNFGSVC